MKLDTKKIKSLVIKNYSTLIMLVMLVYVGYMLWLGYKHIAIIMKDNESVSIQEPELLFNENQYQNIQQDLETRKKEAPVPPNPFHTSIIDSNKPLPR